MRKSLATALVAATIAGGSLAVAAVNPFGIAAAQDSGTTPTAPAAAGKFQSNEDPTHEATETAEQEAAEDAGLRSGHGHFRGGSNEDPAHEATESAEREAAEDAAAAGQTAPSTPAPSSGSTSGSTAQ